MNPLLTTDHAGATFSPDHRLRFTCWRRWAEGRLLPVVMLNPSTADAEKLDPTLTRVMGFARREGAAGFVVLNLWPHRATDPARLWADLADPAQATANGCAEAENLAAIERTITPGPVLVGWGTFSKRPTSMRAESLRVARLVFEQVIARGGEPVALGVTGEGWPRHPLYVRADAPLMPWLMP